MAFRFEPQVAFLERVDALEQENRAGLAQAGNGFCSVVGCHVHAVWAEQVQMKIKTNGGMELIPVQLEIDQPLLCLPRSRSMPDCPAVWVCIGLPCLCA